MDDTSPGNRQRTTHFFSLFLCFAFSPPSIYFFLLRQMFTESNWHVRSPRSSDRESQPEKQRWPSHRSSSFAMISNSHFKKKLGSTIWISKENKKRENEKEKRKTETPSSVSCQIRMQSSLTKVLRKKEASSDYDSRKRTGRRQTSGWHKNPKFNSLLKILKNKKKQKQSN